MNPHPDAEADSPSPSCDRETVDAKVIAARPRRDSASLKIATRSGAYGQQGASAMTRMKAGMLLLCAMLACAGRQLPQSGAGRLSSRSQHRAGG
jgi:hypothetical protein